MNKIDGILKRCPIAGLQILSILFILSKTLPPRLLRSLMPFVALGQSLEVALISPSQFGHAMQVMNVVDSRDFRTGLESFTGAEPGMFPVFAWPLGAWRRRFSRFRSFAFLR